MPIDLSHWEGSFASGIEQIELSVRHRGGALLPIIPDHRRWDDFLESVQAEWRDWRDNLLLHPSCLTVLYGGLALYEYDENTFWPQFAKSVGSNPLPPNQQTEINTEFAKAAKHFGFALRPRGNGIDFVGSAVQHIGIPLSLWDGFLDICEWALWRKDWKTLSQAEWTEAVDRRSGGRRRLKRFLVDNRESASRLVQELLEARDILTDQSLTIGDIAQASILRAAYFDEVPETAEFLRPEDPDSLFQDRARLIWDERRQHICVQLPALKRDTLPATWHIGALSQNAAPNPDVLVLNAQAFRCPLLLRLQSRSHTETQRLRGLDPWGLFDMESAGHLVNPNRDELPLKSYLLVSQDEVEILSREGFDEDENPVNERFEFTDGATGFVTRLWPTGKHAELRLKNSDQSLKTIRFRTRTRIEARFFIGRGRKAAYFSRAAGSKIKIDYWPILCVAIPRGYFKDNRAELAQTFKVLVDGRSAAGGWEERPVRAQIDCDYYEWRWHRRPFLERKPGVNILRDFSQLGGAFKSPDLRGDRAICVEATPHIRVKFEVQLVDRSGEEMDRCWKNLPGAFLPMFMLCQSAEGMKWEELQLAKDVIAPGLRFSPYVLHRYAQHGFLVQRGHRWLIRESQARSIRLDTDRLQLDYCGDPSILWGLYRRMYNQAEGTALPVIEVLDRRGEVPYLRMVWPLRWRSQLETYLKHRGIVMDGNQWIH